MVSTHAKTKISSRGMRLRTKLLLGFLAIILMNVAIGVRNLSVISNLGELVNLTYDKALMSGNFAQASKYDFAKVDVEIANALHAPDIAGFKKHVASARQLSETLQEDLQVVKERALSEKSVHFVGEIMALLEPFERVKAEVLDARERELKAGRQVSDSAIWLRWESAEFKAQIEERLTRLYDDAAETGYRMRLDSEIKNKRNLQLTAWVVGCAFLLGLIFSALFAYTLLKPLKTLLETCFKIENGDYRVRSQISTRDEFGSLSRAFDSMLGKIEIRDNEMGSLLSALPFGVFYFDRRGEISHQRSKATGSIFPNFENLSNFETFVRQLKGTPSETVRENVRIVVDELLPFSSAVELLPARIELTAVVGANSDQRFVDLIYRAQRDADEKVERVIVVAEDVTAKVRAVQESLKQAERVKRISSASKDMAAYREFEPEALTLFDSSRAALTTTGPSALEAAKRDLHSLKGLLGLYQFTATARAVHEIENNLADAPTFSNREAVLSHLETALGDFRKQTDEIGEVLGIKQNGSLVQYEGRKIAALRALAERQRNDEMLSSLLALEQFPVQRVMAKYGAFCERIADKLGDRFVKVEFDLAAADLSYAEAQRLDSALVHLLRNCVDHGIENCDDRMSAGKPEAGTITIKTERLADTSLRLFISDDGGGIDVDRLAEKACANGLWSAEKAKSASVEEKVELIFAAGLSTKAEASEISGRGVGMDAVREHVLAMGGSISVRTSKGRGTQFTIEIPNAEWKRIGRHPEPMAA